MINVEHIEDWRGKDVVDPDGVSLGKLQEVFYDKGTQTPILLATKGGLLSRKVKLIPDRRLPGRAGLHPRRPRQGVGRRVARRRARPGTRTPRSSTRSARPTGCASPSG